MSDFTPPRLSTPAQSGGAGFTYADRVTAEILLALLADVEPLGREGGVPVEIRFEQRPAGELFDDLVVRSASGAQWAVSVKSENPFRHGALDRDLVERGWRSLDNPPAGADGERLLVIASPPPTPETQRALKDLIVYSTEQAPGQTGAWIALPNVGNDAVRKMWESAKGNDPTRDPQILFQSLRLLAYDADLGRSPQSAEIRSRAESLLCETERWEDLWNALLHFAAEGRAVAGLATRDRLVASLPQDLLLRDHGDVEEDWERLRKWGMSRAPHKKTIGNTLTLDTTNDQERITRILVHERLILVTGESGVGKSVTLSRWCEENGGVYVSAEQLDAPAETLRIVRAGRRRLAEIVRLSRRSERVIVLDQVDRLSKDASRGNLRLWLDDLLKDARVRIVMGCASTDSEIWHRYVRDWTGLAPEELRIERSRDEVLGAVRGEHPELAASLDRHPSSPLLVTPRALDQLIGLGSWPRTYAEFLGAVWVNRIQGGEGDSGVREAVRLLAEAEAEDEDGSLREGVASGEVIRSLQSRGVVRDDGRRMTWDHDTTGDQIRAYLLSDPGYLTRRLTGVAPNPLWRRAFLLHCIATLETAGASGFDRLMQTISGSEDGAVLRNTLFDAVILCPAGMNLPAALSSRLVEAGLMKEFVERSLYTAATPMSYDGPEAQNPYWRAHVRVPVWERWTPVVDLVLSQREWFVRECPHLGLEVVVPFLEKVALHQVAAAFALESARRCCGTYYSSRSRQERSRNLAYRAAIAALRSEPENAREFLLRQAGRIADAPPREPSVRGVSLIRPSHKPVRHGPLTRVDHEFRKFYGSDFWPNAVARHDPALAAELFRAVLLREPGPSDASWSEHDEQVGFDLWVGMSPFLLGTHQHPGINGFFERSFEEGLDLVSSMVEVAVETWLSRYGGKEVGLSVEWGEEERFFTGDEKVYQWASGGSTGSYTLRSLLMTLEQRLLETEDEDELGRRVELVLARTNDLAHLSVLISVAKARPFLLVTTLGPVLFHETLDEWDLWVTVSRGHSTHLYGLAGSSWWRDPKKDKRFAEMEHRRRPLRGFHIDYLLSGDRKMAERARTRWLALAAESHGEAAESLRRLAAFYDHSQLRAMRTSDGREMIWVEMPKDLQEISRKVTEETHENVRALMTLYTSQQLLGGGNLCDGIGTFVADWKRAMAWERPGGNTDIGGWLVFLRAAEEGCETEMGDAGSCRSRLHSLIGSLRGKTDGIAAERDISHWSLLVGEHAPSVFGVPPDGPDARRALIAFVERGSGESLQRFARSVFDRPGGSELCLTALRIAQVWAVESVRRRQSRRLSELGNDAIPSAVDLDFERRADEYVRTGDWPVDDRRGLGRPHPGSPFSRRWPPSDLGIVLPGLVQYLEHVGSGEEKALPILTDLLEGLCWREEDRDREIGRAHAWSLLGGVMALFGDTAQAEIVPVCRSEVSSGVSDALDLVTGLLSSYGRGTVEMEPASRVFDKLLEAMRPVDSRGSDSFLSRCFGASDAGRVDWALDRAAPWIARHRAFYEGSVRRLLQKGLPEPLLRRLCRPEFRSLDEVILDEISRKGHALPDLSAGQASALAELIVSWKELVDRSPERRERWRGLLTELEKRGERVAWQFSGEL